MDVTRNTVREGRKINNLRKRNKFFLVIYFLLIKLNYIFFFFRKTEEKPLGEWKNVLRFVRKMVQRPVRHLFSKDPDLSHPTKSSKKWKKPLLARKQQPTSAPPQWHYFKANDWIILSRSKSIVMNIFRLTQKIRI